MKKYTLLKNIITKDKNILYARQAPYWEGEIPQEFINPLNVIVIEDDTQAVVYKQTNVVDKTNYLTENKDTTLAAKFYDPNSVEVINKLDINTLTLEELQKIKGIGDKTAAQLVSNKPYTSLVDLTSKVKPPLGKTWADFHFKYGSTEE